MMAADRAQSRRSRRRDRFATFSVAVDLARRGETVLTLIDPEARDRDPDGYGEWLRARLTIAELPRLIIPGCDARCDGATHDPDALVTLSAIALDPTEPRGPDWWSGWSDSLELAHQSGRIWYAGAPAMPVTPNQRRLAAGTSLRRIASTDPARIAHDRTAEESLYEIGAGPFASDSLVAVSFGPSPLLPGLAGALIAPDHPPARDPQVAIRLLAAGWSAVERGLPFEE